VFGEKGGELQLGSGNLYIFNVSGLRNPDNPDTFPALFKRRASGLHIPEYVYNVRIMFSGIFYTLTLARIQLRHSGTHVLLGLNLSGLCNPDGGYFGHARRARKTGQGFFVNLNNQIFFILLFSLSSSS
jgi:hypothetical protein